ncbi:MAG: rhodanese-like domain-containing protein [Chloroflexi bacterium]|nr:MAG: rhodanese-like domain-containing protein [Chloroflexota bacterium]
MDWLTRTRSNRGMAQQETSFRDLQLDEVKKLIDDGYDVVDVREDWEWNKGHVPGARHVVLSSILANPTGQKFEDQTIFVCQAGERSAVASEMAVALGVKDVVNFRGGTKAWKDAGLPLDKP